MIQYSDAGDLALAGLVVFAHAAIGTMKQRARSGRAAVYSQYG